MAQEDKKTPYLYIPLNLEETIQELTDEEKGKIFKAIFKYASSGEVAKFDDRILKLVFLQFKKNQDDNISRYKKICEQNRNNVLQRWNNRKSVENKGENTDVYDGIPTNTNEYDRLRIIPNKNKKEKEKKNKIKSKNKTKIENKNNIKKEKVVKRKKANADGVATTTTTTTDFSSSFHFDDIVEIGKKFGINADYCKKFYAYYESNNWETMKGEKIVNVERLLKKWYNEDKKNKKAVGFISNDEEAIENDTKRIFENI